MAEPVRILCVDDEKNTLRALERLFMDDDYEVLTADSGRAGISVLEAFSPVQIVISDNRMPEMSGVEFLRLVRERWPRTVRIILSGYADISSVVAAINEGQVYKFIPKPWDDDALRMTVVNALQWYGLQQENARGQELVRSWGENGPILSPDVFFDLLPFAVVAMDESGNIRESNRKAKERFGRGGSVPGDPWSSLPGEARRLFDRLTGGEEGRVHLAWETGEVWAYRLSGREGARRIVLVLYERNSDE